MLRRILPILITSIVCFVLGFMVSVGLDKYNNKDIVKDKSLVKTLITQSLGNKKADEKDAYFKNLIKIGLLDRKVYESHFDFTDLSVIQNWGGTTGKQEMIGDPELIRETEEGKVYIIKASYSKPHTIEINDGAGTIPNTDLLRRFVFEVVVNDGKVIRIDDVGESKFIQYDEDGNKISESYIVQ